MYRDPTGGSWLDHCRVEVQELCRIALREVSEKMEGGDILCRQQPTICVNRSKEAHL